MIIEKSLKNGASRLALAAALFILPAVSWAGDTAKDLKPSADAWPLFRGDLAGTGIASSKVADDLKVDWVFDAEGDIEGTAVIADGRVFFGTFEGEFFALDLESGKKIWSFQVEDAAIQSTPAAYDGTVYFGDEFGWFYALDAATGEERWRFETRAEILSSPTFHADLVLIGSYDQFLYALERKSGEVRWKVETDGYIHATPTFLGDTVTVSGCDGYLWQIRAIDGEVVEKLDLGGQAGSSPAVRDGVAYLGTFENQVLALDVETKKVLWRYEHPKRKFPYYASAAVTDDAVLIGGRDKILRSLDRKTGETNWEWNSGGRIDSSVVVVGDRGFVGTKVGKVVAFDIATGELSWEFDTGSAIVASPAVAKGRVVIGTLDGQIYSFK